MYCMLLGGERGGSCDGWDGELRLWSGLDAEESTLSVFAVAVAGGSGDAAVTVVMGGEDGADLEVLPNNLRTESESRLTKFVRGMELSLAASDSIAHMGSNS